MITPGHADWQLKQDREQQSTRITAKVVRLLFLLPEMHTTDRIELDELVEEVSAAGFHRVHLSCPVLKVTQVGSVRPNP